MARKENNFEILNQKIVSYLTDINDLKNENSKLSENITKLTKENTDLKSEIEVLKEK